MMSYSEECEVCKKELKGAFVWVSCRYWNGHPVSECNGCEYPVGMGCVKHIPKEFHGRTTSVDEWIDEQEKMNAEENDE